MGVVGVFVLPCSPVLVPEVGRGRERSAVQTIAACRRAGRAARALAPESLLLLLPGTEEEPALLRPIDGGWRRSFEEFDAPELSRIQPVDEALIEALAGRPSSTGMTARQVVEPPTSALAPLYFLSSEARTPVAAVEMTGGDIAEAVEFGTGVAAVARRLGRRVAVVAVGELSSRIFPGAPGGYEPDAAAFDHAVVEMVAAANLEGLRRIEPAQRETAGDGLVPQLAAALAALPGGIAEEPPSYEHPFGVGYLVARFTPRGNEE